MNPGQRRDRQLVARPVRRFCLFMLCTVLLVQLAVSAWAWLLAGSRVVPGLERKAAVVASSLGARLTGAIARGTPIDQAGGVQEYFDATLRQNPDLAFIVLANPTGKVLYRSGSGGEIIAPERYARKSADIMHRYVSYGEVQVGVDRDYLRAQLGELPFGLLIVLIASLLAIAELLRWAVTLAVVAPMRQALSLMVQMADGDFRHRAGGCALQSLAGKLNATVDRINRSFGELARLAAEPARRAVAEPMVRRLRATYQFAERGSRRNLPQQRVGALRVLVFVPLFAELLTRPLLPAYAAAFDTGAGALPHQLRASFPASCLLLGAALSMPFASRWPDRAGRRTCYLAGALLAAAGIAATALAAAYGPMLAARALTGAGYALMLAACLDCAFDSASIEGKGAAVVTLAGALLVAEICAPAIGAVLAVHAGHAAVFTSAALLAASAAPLALAMLDNQSARVCKPLLLPLRGAAPGVNYRLLALATLCAIPTVFVYAGVLMFLAPLAVPMGAHTILYGAVAAVLAPAFYWMGGHYNGYAPLACLGTLISGLGLLPLGDGAAADAIFLATGVVGLGHAMSIPALAVLALRFSQGAAAAIPGGWRLGLCLGAALGPVFAAGIATVWGVPHAFKVFGLVAISAAFLFALALLMQGERDAATD